MSEERPEYSAKFIRFVRMPMHAEAYRAAYLDQSLSSRNELERLRREYATLPPHHAGWCVGECPSERCTYTQNECARRRHFHSPCLECRRLRANVQYRDIGAEIYGTSVASSRVPDVTILDLERALDVLGERESAYNIAQWLSGHAA